MTGIQAIIDVLEQPHVHAEHVPLAMVEAASLLRAIQGVDPVDGDTVSEHAERLEIFSHAELALHAACMRANWKNALAKIEHLRRELAQVRLYEQENSPSTLPAPPIEETPDSDE